jgi:cobyrinic acid a,c-diamide synthase
MKIDLTGIVIIVGNYGSGKTEVTINLAAFFRRAGHRVQVADLDLVNPYFRTREARLQLRRLGVQMVLPEDGYLHADLPVLSPAVAGAIRSRDTQEGITLLDAGGDDVGATVLATFTELLKQPPVEMIQVVNPFRPFTDTVAGCRKIRKQIEAASRLKVTGVVGNANLIDETTAETVYEGYAFIQAVSRQEDLPLKFITIASPLLPGIDPEGFACPVLPIERQLVPPWKRASPLSN